MTLKLFYLNDPLESVNVRPYRFGKNGKHYAYDLYSLYTGSDADAAGSPQLTLVQRNVELADWHYASSASSCYKATVLGGIDDVSEVEASRKLFVTDSGGIDAIKDGLYEAVDAPSMAYADGLFAVASDGSLYKYEYTDVAHYMEGDFTRVTGVSDVLKVAANKARTNEYMIYDGTATTIYNGNTVVKQLSAPGDVADIIGMSSRVEASSYSYLCTLKNGSAYIIENIRQTWTDTNIRDAQQVIPMSHTRTASGNRPYYYFLVLYYNGQLKQQWSYLSGSNVNSMTLNNTMQDITADEVQKWVRVFYDCTGTNKYHLIGMRQI